MNSEDAIDAVITWVDGNAPAHRALRARYMAETTTLLGENARNPHRWESSDEILYCLRSIHNHAPWIRHIWIVVAQAGPDLSSLPQGLRDKVRLVTHDEVFEGYADVLPTFNSLAIESMMWRIEGLAKRFLYFNDDVFLTAPLEPCDMFEGMHPVLRGKWRDIVDMSVDEDAQNDPALFNHFMQMNAAYIGGISAGALFAAAHVVHPMRRDIMADLFDTYCDAFEGNIAHRFRDLSQFLPQGLHNHHLINLEQVAFAQTTDHLHIKSGQGAGEPSSMTRALLLPEQLAGMKFLCVNDLPQLEVLVPDARALIAQAVGD